MYSEVVKARLAAELDEMRATGLLKILEEPAKLTSWEKR